MLQYWIWLATRKKIGNYKKRLLLDAFGTPEAVYLADKETLQSAVELSATELSSLDDKNLMEAESVLRKCDNKRISVLTFYDAAYPDRLRNISDPPLVLYYEGCIPNVDSYATIGVVGTREASLHGLKHAKELGYQLGRGGAIVVSGSARGIDTKCLEGALSAGNPVISVLGNGTDVVYPKENRMLYEDVRRNGCLITEFPPGTPGWPKNFPVRNRIISGLSVGVVVVEAPVDSGALITARRALDQGRDVFTYPLNVGVDAFRGNVKLLKDGAIPIEDGSDVLKEYVGRFALIQNSAKTNLKNLPPERRWQETDKKAVDKQITENYIDLNTILQDVSEDGAKILLSLKDGSKHVDDIVNGTGIPASKVSTAMTILGIKKYVKKLPGQRFELADNIKAGK